MKKEEYKNTLSRVEKANFEALENQILEGIAKSQDVVNALELLEFFPKKDGSEKANFSLNFGLRTPYGETYTIKWVNAEEKRRRPWRVVIGGGVS